VNPRAKFHLLHGKHHVQADDYRVAMVGPKRVVHHQDISEVDTGPDHRILLRPDKVGGGRVFVAQLVQIQACST
jgi:hypothetical protein